MHIDSLLQQAADLIGPRGLVLALGGWLLLAPPHDSPLQWLDQGLFHLGQMLAPESVDYGWPKDTAQSWDWGKIQGLLAVEQNRLDYQAALPDSVMYTTPWWFYPAQALIGLALMLYLLWWVPALSLAAALLSASLLLLLLLVVQLGAQLARGYWLPLGLQDQYLALGLVLMGADWLRQGWYRQSQALRRLLSAERMQAGHWRAARDILKPCTTSPRLLALLYSQAREHETAGRQREALASYQALEARKPGYRDVGQRLPGLIQAQTPARTGGVADLDSTRVLAEFTQPTRLGRYEVEQELGRGAMGVVYLAQDPQIARRVALKTLDCMAFDEQERGSVKARFFREAEAAGSLRHPNIVTVYDLGEEGDLAYIAMDYIAGRPLSDYTRKENLLPAKKVYRLIAEVAEALAYAHEQSVVHRDIKPGNILYEAEREKAVVTDFGIARVANSARTQTGEILGSPLYMSPEQLKGVRVGPASDIFSLGVSFYQLLTGALPFRGESLAELSYQIVQSRQRPVREQGVSLPRSATRIVNKALQKDPVKRYASAAEMARALRLALARDF